MKVAVIGAGVIGVTSAWYLARDGHQVTVIERQPGPARETSFANGGQISVSHAEPWSSPATPGKLLRWLGRDDAPLLWRLRADPVQWAWGGRFLSECRPARFRRNTEALVRLGLYSRTQLAILRDELGLAYEQRLRGILHIYGDQKSWQHACRQAERMRSFGCERHPVSGEECRHLEPALAASEAPIYGGTYTAQDESGDAWRFSCELARSAAVAGVSFRFDTAVDGLVAEAGKVRAVRLAGGEVFCADAYVVACGSYSPQLLGQIGMHVPIYPVKGYSATYTTDAVAALPTVSLTDEAHKLVYSRLGDRLRVAGTAEFCGYDLSLNARRCQALAARAELLFPALRRASGPEFWAGLRPATPGNVPFVGRTGLANLWLNSGHGTLGWTLACGSGRLLADLLAGRAPEISPQAYALPGKA